MAKKVGSIERDYQDLKYPRRQLVSVVVGDPSNPARSLVAEAEADGVRLYENGTCTHFVDHRVTGLRMLGLDENQKLSLARKAKKRQSTT